jgi:hypothetical protein
MPAPFVPVPADPAPPPSPEGAAPPSALPAGEVLIMLALAAALVPEVYPPPPATINAVKPPELIFATPEPPPQERTPPWAPTITLSMSPGFTDKMAGTTAPKPLPAAPILQSTQYLVLRIEKSLTLIVCN